MFPLDSNRVQQPHKLIVSESHNEKKQSQHLNALVIIKGFPNEMVPFFKSFLAVFPAQPLEGLQQRVGEVVFFLGHAGRKAPEP